MSHFVFNYGRPSLFRCITCAFQYRRPVSPLSRNWELNRPTGTNPSRPRFGVRGMVSRPRDLSHPPLSIYHHLFIYLSLYIYRSILIYLSTCKLSFTLASVRLCFYTRDQNQVIWHTVQEFRIFIFN